MNTQLLTNVKSNLQHIPIYLSELPTKTRAYTLNKLTHFVYSLPYNTPPANQIQSIVNHSSKTFLRTFINIIRKRIEDYLADEKNRISPVHYYQRLEYLTNLIDLIEENYFDFSPATRRAFLQCLGINNIETSQTPRQAFREKNGFESPSLLVISPFMTCNLKCKGCYAKEYQQRYHLTDEEIDDILNQAKEIGIYFITISGGEPFSKKDSIFRMLENHNDMFFLFYTNGTLIDEETAAILAEKGNVAVSISVEGFKKEIDDRRGSGVHKAITEAMKRLKENGVFYGISFTAMKHNHDILIERDRDPETGRSFFEYWMDDMGAYYAWIFQYIPIGENPNFDNFPTPSQTIERGEHLRKLRREGRVVVDFWNDGYLGGKPACMAGGRNYIHINNKGDVEPCVFAHYTKKGLNIREQGLEEILKSDYFTHLRSREFKNPLTCCMIIHHPQYLREDFKKFGLRSTDSLPSLVKSQEIISKLNKWSEEYGKLADETHNKLMAHYSNLNIE